MLILGTASLAVLAIYWQSLFWIITTDKLFFEDSVDGGQIRAW